MRLAVLLLLCAGLLSACGQAGPVTSAEASAPETSAAVDVTPAAQPADSGLVREAQLAVGEETYTIRRIVEDEGHLWDPVVDTVEIP